MPRYDSLRKVKPGVVIKLLKDHPDWSYREIGDWMGCSRMRVFRIVNDTLRNSIYSIIEHSIMCMEA